ncbi:excinuclease ABC subunit UvrC, partial [bacterium]|nr:excinuclease ABC subunit UvrC [bacterium]
MSRKDSRLREDIKKMPKLPGIYMMKGAGSKIIYVGKAKNLNNRIRNYFSKYAENDPKTGALMRKVREIDYVTTESEVEALVLECNFIKENRPTYNIKLKDDKKYPYIKLTMKDKYPRLILVRNIIKDGSEYFGPYTEARSLRKTLSIIGDIFPLRRCSDRKFKQKRERECLYYQIGKCSAPCTGRIGEKEYRKLIEQVRLFLKGRNRKLITNLRTEMQRLSEVKEYEKAAMLRDQIQSVERISEKQLALDPGGSDEDILALSREYNQYCAVVMKIREGKILASETFILPSVRESERSLVSESFIKLYYNATMDIPPVIYLRDNPPDKELLTKWLYKKTARAVKIKVPKRGRKKKLLEFAERNAELKLFSSPQGLRRDVRLLDETEKTLGLPVTPFIVEGYDISNIQGNLAVGSMVVFRNGKPYKKGYRHFRIKTVKGINDFAMMAEVIARRFGDTKENKDSRVIPHLILIDGGRGQVSAVMGSLKEVGLEKIP